MDLDLIDRPGICPEHGRDTDGEFDGWSHCPIRVDLDGVEHLDCRHFLAELQRRINEMQAGNYVRTWRDDDGTRWKQKFREHQPVGEAQQWGRGR